MDSNNRKIKNHPQSPLRIYTTVTIQYCRIEKHVSANKKSHLTYVCIIVTLSSRIRKVVASHAQVARSIPG